MHRAIVGWSAPIALLADPVIHRATSLHVSIGRWLAVFGRISLFVWMVCRGEAIAESTAVSIGGGASHGRVVVVANSLQPESVKLAEHYAARRSLPADHIVTLPLTQEETMTWREFVATLWQPLQELLMKRGWIDATAMLPVDAAGRRKHVIHGHTIDYLVLCRGLPLRIAHEPTIRDVPEIHMRGSKHEFLTNQAAVDSELALLGMGPKPAMGFVANPLFGSLNNHATTGPRVIKVMRLDGPGWESARALIDRSIETEQRGLIGQAYVDIGGPYPPGDVWFEEVCVELRKLGFQPVVDRAQATFGMDARCDAPALYFGWYSSDLDGPFRLPGLRLAPGAIAYHLHSFSAHTLRDPTKGWVGPLVAKGAAGTVGYVFEPYLVLTQNPVLWLRRLGSGARLGEALYHSLPALSWQTTLIGDPLYRPFAVSAEVQWQRRREFPTRLRPYVALRKLCLEESGEEGGHALGWALEEMEETPSLALGYALVVMLRRVGRPTEAKRVLEWIARDEALSIPAEDWTLAWTIVEEASALEQIECAWKLSLKLLNNSYIPLILRRHWLPLAIRMAKRMGEERQALEWEREWMETPNR